MKLSFPSCIIVCMILLLSGVFAGCFDKTWIQSGDETYQVYVTDVIDGDTVRVIMPDGKEEALRFLGIDAPEVSEDSSNPFEYGDITNVSCLKKYGLIAKSFVYDLLVNTEIRIEFDVSAGVHDSYGRLLAYVYTMDGIDVNALLIQHGFSRVYTEETFSKELYYVQVENEAKNNSTGLWSCSERKHTGVHISLVHYNALGDDGINLNDEYVCITYYSNEAESKHLNLTGYTLSDDDGYTFIFPNGFGIDDGHILTIHTGLGENTLTDLYWGCNTPIWNNDGEIAYLQNKYGDLIDSYQWN